MKLLLLCPSLEPGRSGVGDYTRRLGAECIRQGFPAVAASLHEAGLSHPVDEDQTDSSTPVRVLRLPAHMDWSERWERLADWEPGKDAEVLSLQFVCFGFHPKGLMPFGFGRQLRTLAGKRPVHLMFHEIWLGVRTDASFKVRVWGALQKSLILRMVAHLQPESIQTQALPYLSILKQAGMEGVHRPLFGNIPLVELTGNQQRLRRMELVTDAQKAGLPEGDFNPLLVGLFGTLYPEWTADSLMAAFLPAAKALGRKVVFVLLGRHGRSGAEIASWCRSAPEGMVWLELGVLPPETLSMTIQALDFGAVATPLAMLEKSGAAAAFADHGVPVVVTRDDCCFRIPCVVPRPNGERHHFCNEYLTDWLLKTRPQTPRSLLPAATTHFLKDALQIQRSAEKTTATIDE
jgi:hypothetical protein